MFNNKTLKFKIFFKFWVILYSVCVCHCGDEKIQRYDVDVPGGIENEVYRISFCPSIVCLFVLTVHCTHT